MSGNDSPTTHQLHVMMEKLHGRLDVMEKEVDGKLDLIIYQGKESRKWQEEHANADKLEHEKIHSRISSMKSYAASISLLSGLIGYFLSPLVKFFGTKTGL